MATTGAVFSEGEVVDIKTNPSVELAENIQLMKLLHELKANFPTVQDEIVKKLVLQVRHHTVSVLKYIPRNGATSHLLNYRRKPPTVTSPKQIFRIPSHLLKKTRLVTSLKQIFCIVSHLRNKFSFLGTSNTPHLKILVHYHHI